MGKAHDLTGKVFGDLTVLHRADNSRHGKTRWHCTCKCGQTITTLAACLLNDYTKSCGCHRATVPAIVNRTHGGSRTRTYRIWCNVKARCRDPDNPSYARYGARGIDVCEKWATSFAAFLADMGPSPAGLSIDRINNARGYEPGNCRWATPKQQTDNSSRPRLITFDSQTKNLSEWARYLGINEATLHERLHKWPLQEALSRGKSHRWSRRPTPKTLG